MNRTILTAAVIATACFSAIAQAQTQYQGVDIYAAGAHPGTVGFQNPNTNQAFKMVDDGTTGDVTAGDGVYSVDYLMTETPAADDGRYPWKVASAGYSPVNIPSGGDMFNKGVSGQTVKYLLRTTPFNDGFLPDMAPSTQFAMGVPYARPTFATAANVAGSFNGFNPTDPATAMNDSGTSGDLTAADGIWTVTLSGLAVGTYECKIVPNNGMWSFAVGSDGGWNRGGNISFTTVSPTDTVLVQLDTNNGGRYKLTVDNPVVNNPGPPFFAESAAWGNGKNATTQMYDDGTNGDVTSGDGIYGRNIVAATAGNFGVKATQYVGASYPESGEGYPITIGTVGQAVLVQLDTNTKTDGYSPNTRYVWTDPASRRTYTYVQAVGNFMDETLVGAGDWNPNDPVFQLVDNGTSGDYTAADAVFANTYSIPAGSYLGKAVGQQSFSPVQFGGNGEGATQNGDNDAIAFSGGNVVFTVDTITGRMAAFSNTATVPVDRPATLNAAATTSVSDWSIY